MTAGGSAPAGNQAREYRVVWQREGATKRRTIRQTEAAAQRFALVLQGRLAEATGLDPDGYSCCDGYECGCGGRSRAQDWAAATSRIASLIYGPVIESRSVGSWEATGSCV